MFVVSIITMFVVSILVAMFVVAKVAVARSVPCLLLQKSLLLVLVVSSLGNHRQ
jgi:hypothetical protein